MVSEHDAERNLELIKRVQNSIPSFSCIASGHNVTGEDKQIRFFLICNSAETRHRLDKLSIAILRLIKADMHICKLGNLELTVLIEFENRVLSISDLNEEGRHECQRQ